MRINEHPQRKIRERPARSSVQYTCQCRFVPCGMLTRALSHLISNVSVDGNGSTLFQSALWKLFPGLFLIFFKRVTTNLPVTHRAQGTVSQRSESQVMLAWANNGSLHIALLLPLQYTLFLLSFYYTWLMASNLLCFFLPRLHHPVVPSCHNSSLT